MSNIIGVDLLFVLSSLLTPKGGTRDRNSGIVDIFLVLFRIYVVCWTLVFYFLFRNIFLLQAHFFKIFFWEHDSAIWLIHAHTQTFQFCNSLRQVKCLYVTYINKLSNRCLNINRTTAYIYYTIEKYLIHQTPPYPLLASANGKKLTVDDTRCWC